MNVAVVTTRLAEHIGDPSVGPTLTEDIRAAIDLIAEQRREIDQLRFDRVDFKLRWKHACERADRLERAAGRP